MQGPRARSPGRIDERRAIRLPRESLQALGVSPGGERVLILYGERVILARAADPAADDWWALSEAALAAVWDDAANDVGDDA